jgi:hypothetical protein
MASTIDPARRAQLNMMRVAALVGDSGSIATEVTGAIGAGSAVLAEDGTAWILLADLGERGPERQLGAALAWALRHGARRARVIAESGTGVLARRAESFSFDVLVSHLEGRDLFDAVAEPLPPSAEPGEPDEQLRQLIDLIVAGGATPVFEHGVVAGEVDGLEVCRVVADPATGELRLEVGVGAHDRETFQMLHGDRPTRDSLHDVVHTVAQHRRPGSPMHPLNQLAASRLLRARLIADPAQVGAAALVAVEPPIARRNLKDQLPCAAVEPGTGTLVVCTTGIDLDVVPWSADAVSKHAADRCQIVAPARDVIDVQRRLAELVRIPTTFIGV